MSINKQLETRVKGCGKKTLALPTKSQPFPPCGDQWTVNWAMARASGCITVKSESIFGMEKEKTFRAKTEVQALNNAMSKAMPYLYRCYAATVVC